MPASYFIYYRIAGSVDLPAARDTIARLQQAIKAASGVAGRLLQDGGDPPTWMEIYEPVADARAFEHLLDALEPDFAVEALVAPGSRRHRERFQPCA